MLKTYAATIHENSMAAPARKIDTCDFICITLAGSALGCIIFMFFPTLFDIIHLTQLTENVEAAERAYWAQQDTEQPLNIILGFYIQSAHLLIYAKNAIEYGITGIIVGGAIGAAIANTAEKRNA